MAKRKPKPKNSTVEEIIELFLDGAAFTHDAEDIRCQTAAIQPVVDEWDARADRADAKGKILLKRSAQMAAALQPDGMAELLAKAPGSLRTILIPSIAKMPPAAL
jgi:hypothetical protein